MPLQRAADAVGLAEALQPLALGRQRQACPWSVSNGIAGFMRAGLAKAILVAPGLISTTLSLPGVASACCCSRARNAVSAATSASYCATSALAIRSSSRAISALSSVSSAACCSRRLARRGKLGLALGKLRLLLLEQLVDAAALGGKPVGLALLGIALLANAGLQFDQAVELLRQIVGLIFQLGKHLGQQHRAAHHGKRIVAARDERRRRRAADPLHGARAF